MRRRPTGCCANQLAQAPRRSVDGLAPSKGAALGANPADLREPSEELGSWDADINESARREHRARDLYAEFAGRATSPRLREVWTAVSAIEADHIELDTLAKGYI